MINGRFKTISGTHLFDTHSPLPALIRYIFGPACLLYFKKNFSLSAFQSLPVYYYFMGFSRQKGLIFFGRFYNKMATVSAYQSLPVYYYFMGFSCQKGLLFFGRFYNKMATVGRLHTFRARPFQFALCCSVVLRQLYNVQISFVSFRRLNHDFALVEGHLFLG